MNRERSLCRLVAWANKKFAEFESLSGGLVAPLDADEWPTARFLALEAANTWASFLRTYYLSSATGAWCTGGTKIVGQGNTSSFPWKTNLNRGNTNVSRKTVTLMAIAAMTPG